MRLLRLLLGIWCLCHLGLIALAQEQPTIPFVADLRLLLQKNKAGTKRAQILLQLSAFYLHKEGASSQDLDSALVLAQQAEGLSRQYHFAPGIDEARFLMGSINIQQHATSRVLTAMNNLSDTSRIKLLLEVGKKKLEANVLGPKNRDSALYFFQQANKLSNRVSLRKWNEESLFQLGAYYFQGGDLPRGKAYFMQVIKADGREGNTIGTSRAWFRLGTALPPKAQYDAEKMGCYQNALLLANQAHDQQQQALILYEIARVYYRQSKAELAERELLRALAIQKAAGDKKIYITYEALISVYKDKGDFISMLSYALEAVNILKTSREFTGLDIIYFQLGNVYFDLGHFAKSVVAYRLSLAISQQKGQVVADMYLVKNLTKALIKQKQEEEALQFLQRISRINLRLNPRDRMILAESMGECYTALHQLKRAEKYYLQSVQWNNQLEQWEGLPAYGGIGRFYVTTRQYRKAGPYIRSVLAAPTGMVPPSVIQEFHLLQFKVDSAAGNYLAAIVHFRQHKALADSIFSAVKNRQLEELQVQYETSQKEQRIQLLIAKGERQQSELKRAQTTRNAIIAGAILLVGLLGVSYNRYRLKQRNNQLLEAKQQLLESKQIEINDKNLALEKVLDEKDALLGEKEELLVEKEWMLKEIHHRVKNNLQIISSMLSSQSNYLHDPTSLAALRESQNRVQTMALIHQKLYQSESLARVNMQEFVREIVDHLLESFNCEYSVWTHLNILAVELEVAMAMPVGLIINEAMTNALKYAFPQNRRGTIAIELTSLNNQLYQVSIADDGIGLPPGFEFEHSPTLGLTMIKGLSKQLHGKLTFSQEGGVRISLQFEVAKTLRRPASVSA